MRGRITIIIRKRIITQSKQYKDKWDVMDIVRLVTIEKNWFQVNGKRINNTFRITKDEVAFVRFIFQVFGTGDYSILIYGKGKNKGLRRFWDGLITEERTFLRRKEMSYLGGNPSMYERDSKAENTESFIGRYMKTKRPGKWYNF